MNRTFAAGYKDNHIMAQGTDPVKVVKELKKIVEYMGDTELNPKFIQWFELVPIKVEVDMKISVTIK